MKRSVKILLTIVLAGIAVCAVSQDRPVVVADFMKVDAGKENRYLELEKDWKKIHQARLEKGYITGWQLWQKMYASPEDDDRFITLNWYENFEKSSEKGTAEVIGELFNERELEELMKRTLKARDQENTEVMHRVTGTENNNPVEFIVIYQLKVGAANQEDYIRMKKEIFKPIYEEAVKRGEMGTWSIWSRWPFDDDDYQFVAVNGFGEFSQMQNVNFAEIIKKVHPDLDTEELKQKITKARKVTAVQIWKLLDQVMPEGGHE